MMIAQFFVDTNVLVYAGSNAPEDQTKKQRAREVLARPGIGFSAQVMQEFYNAAVRKQRLQITHEEAEAILDAMRPFPVLPITRELVRDAIRISAWHGLSYWDAAIIAAARELGCHTLYSEDLNSEQTYSGVKVVNPFS